ncbi:type II toxin-antitoxin system VapC family toxin [Gemmata sp. SH-PL17]|uniref:type II toxin-antitoxin system VapC family toxin n=1 Tax=Gemmata sp. SH-PL17 TaxID=1630693 RepID=UPI00138FD8CC|nr:type II toxin-antitoxin system VapC family toxin [Gemmata sp. SH-PL17]
MIVLDACVATKLFVVEHQSEAAARLVARYPLLLAPELVGLEVTSAITRKARNRELDRPAAERALGSWWEFLRLGNLRLTPDRALMTEAADRSLALGHPLADCLYLTLAARHNVPLVTADTPFYDAVHGTFPSIHLLAEFGTGNP